MDLFAYGTLMDPEIMARVSGRRYDSCRATLRDFARKQVRGEVYPGIVEKEGAAVDGYVYFDLLPSSFERLDGFEGPLYRRIEVTAICEDGRRATAQTFAIAPAYRHRLSDQDWNYREFLRKNKAAFENHYAGYRALE